MLIKSRFVCSVDCFTTFAMTVLHHWWNPIIKITVHCNDALLLGCRHCEARSNPLSCTPVGLCGLLHCVRNDGTSSLVVSHRTGYLPVAHADL